MKTMTTLTITAFFLTTQAQITSVGLTASQIDGIAHLNNGMHYVSSYHDGFLLYDEDLNLVENVTYPFTISQATTTLLSGANGNPQVAPGYLSNTLFDNDPTTLEYMYQAYVSFDELYHVVARVGGGVVMVFPHGYQLKRIDNTANGAILVMNYSLGNTTAGHVFNLPGTLPCAACDGTVTLMEGNTDHSPEEPFQVALPGNVYQVFPNPGNGQFQVEVEVPEELSHVEFVVRSLAGAELHRVQYQSSGVYRIDLGPMAAGVYATECTGPRGRIGPGQMLIIQ